MQGRSQRDGGILIPAPRSESGTAWNLQADDGIASESIQYVSVSDSNAGPAGTYEQMDASLSTDGGNNTNWNFGATGNAFMVFF